MADAVQNQSLIPESTEILWENMGKNKSISEYFNADSSTLIMCKLRNKQTSLQQEQKKAKSFQIKASITDTLDQRQQIRGKRKLQ